MDGFSQRKKAFETQFSHDEELRFRTTAKRNHMLGLWAAEMMRLEDEDAQAYARELIASSFEYPENDEVAKKVCRDLEKSGESISKHKVLKKLDALHREAFELVHKDKER